MFSKLFEENKKAPDETVICLSKSYYYSRIFITIIWLALGVLTFFIGYEIFGILLIGFVLYQIKDFITIFKTINDNQVQMTLSSKGISLHNRKLIPWKSITNEKVILKPNYVASAISKEFLTFEANGIENKIFINNLDISSSRLEYLLKIYRKRNSQKS